MPLSGAPTSFDPQRPDVAPYGLTSVRWLPTPTRWPDHHNEIELNFIESGSVTYLPGGDKITLEAGRLTAFWPAIPDQIIDFGLKTTVLRRRDSVAVVSAVALAGAFFPRAEAGHRDDGTDSAQRLRRS